MPHDDGTIKFCKILKIVYKKPQEIELKTKEKKKRKSHASLIVLICECNSSRLSTCGNIEFIF